MIDLSAIPLTDPLRVAIGAGDQRWDGWVPTNKEQLDLLDRRGWEASFQGRLADAFLCEHVWEHLTEHEGRAGFSVDLLEYCDENGRFHYNESGD